MENITNVQIPVHAISTLIFYILLIAYIIFTVIFYYHWSNFSMSNAATKETYLAYFIISVPLLAIMGLSVYLI